MSRDRVLSKEGLLTCTSSTTDDGSQNEERTAS